MGNTEIETLQINKELKDAVIFGRVSTHDQAETSIPQQISRCREKLESEGYNARHILTADWTSMDLYNCPQFQELRSLIINREIEALAVFDRDRLEAQGYQRVVFFKECSQAGVRIILCQGPPILDDRTGPLVEMALALAKEEQVLRARQGSRDGLAYRTKKRGLPASYRKIYGYKWHKEENILVPDETYENAKLIFELAKDGSGFRLIAQELRRRGILSPTGKTEWDRSTISHILHNPVYAGRYYAMRTMVIEPKDGNRKGSTYGKTSHKRIPLEEAQYMPNIKVQNPLIAWDEREFLLKQLIQRQKISQRNAKYDYLLRGFVKCGTHFGKRGDPRTYHGQPKYKNYRYTCPEGGCPRPYLDGPDLEYIAKDAVQLLLLKDDSIWDSVKKQSLPKTRKALNDELTKLEKQFNGTIDAEIKLEERFLFGKVSVEAVDILKEQLSKKRVWLKTEIANKTIQLAHINEYEAAKESINSLRLKLVVDAEELKEKLTNEEWRQLFSSLNMVIIVRSAEERRQYINDYARYKGGYEEKVVYRNKIYTNVGVGDEKKIVAQTIICGNISAVDIDLQFDVPIQEELIKSSVDIALKIPWCIHR